MVAAASLSTICAARARLIAARTLRGHGSWEAFFRANQLDRATWFAWLSGRGVRPDFIRQAAGALGMSYASLAHLRDEIVQAERGGSSP